MRGVHLDLRDRCKRERCGKLIRKGWLSQQNWHIYKPYCSYACQEWHRLEEAQRYIAFRTPPASKEQTGGRG